MFEVKIKKYFEDSFQNLNDYLNDSLISNERKLKVGDWVMMCSIIANLDGEISMYSIEDIIELNKVREINVLERSGNFSVVIIRGLIDEKLDNGYLIKIEENEETVYYELNGHGSKLYNSLLIPNSFIWNMSDLKNGDNLKFINPQLEELPLFLLNLVKLEDVFAPIASKVLETLTSIIFNQETQLEEGRDWYEEKRIIVVKTFKKAQLENNMPKH